MLYVYLHFYLGMLWKGLAGLPAKFPDGKRLDERAYPWLLNGLVRRHFALLLREGRPRLVQLKELTTIFLAWWTVPLTLFAFWVRYLRRHEGWGTGLHIGVLVAAVALGIIFYRSAARTLRGDQPPRFAWKAFSWDRTIYQVAGSAVMLLGLSFGAIEVPWVSADLVEAELSTKPENWTGIGKKEELDAQIAQVKGARLEGMDLRHALAVGAFLVKANLEDANLQGAFLVKAKLQGAHLVAANLQEAMLEDANLQGADLGLAKLQGASLYYANLQGASFQDAELRGTKLRYARGLSQKQLDLACGDAETELPTGKKIKTCPQEKKEQTEEEKK